nr:MAG TPA: ImpA-related domain protein [Bacteriophage sp.]
MKREQAKELLPIIQALAEGKSIEYKDIYGNWIDSDEVMVSNPPENYRIKSIYRPFKDKEECYNEMLKHQPFGWLKGKRLLYNIISIHADGIIIHNSISSGGYSFKSAFSLTFADGTPFGIKE